MAGRDDRIDYLKALACLLVVCCHVIISRTGFGDYTPFLQALWQLSFTVCIPLFIGIAGWLSHAEPLRPYLLKKARRVLAPFFLFSLLKLFYSSFVSARYAHGDTLAARLADAFVFGRLYWFAYAIWVILMLAPLLWRLSLPWLSAAFAASLALSLLWARFPSWLCIDAAVSLFPCFVAGMLARRLHDAGFLSSPRGRLCARGALALAGLGAALYLLWFPVLVPNRIVFFASAAALILPLVWGFSRLPRGIGALAFVGRNAWAIMFLDAFFKAVLLRFLDAPAAMPLVVALDLALSALACRLLARLPGSSWLGVSG